MDKYHIRKVKGKIFMGNYCQNTSYADQSSLTPLILSLCLFSDFDVEQVAA